MIIHNRRNEKPSPMLPMATRMRWFYWFGGCLIFFIVWKLNNVEQTDIDTARRIISYYKDELKLTEEQLRLLRNLGSNENSRKIYAITPTYKRLVQKAELTRISQTLALIPNLHWIIIEDADQRTSLVTNLLMDSDLEYTHLFAKTPPFAQLKAKMPRYTRHRGVEQRNAALKWLRNNLNPERDKGVVYFMDDDNTYSIKLFKEIEKVNKVGVWPVGLVGGLNGEVPIIDPKTGKVSGYISGWKPNRTFAIDMAGFAINLELVLKKQEAVFSYTMQKGFQESQFLTFFTTKEELEPLADNCTKVYVWHTRTENPKVQGDPDCSEEKSNNIYRLVYRDFPMKIYS